MQREGINKVVDTLFWFRRDLRIEDNTGLTQALKNGENVQAIFIFDANLLESLSNSDGRVSFIYSCLESLHNTLRQYGSSLLVFHGTPELVFGNIKKQFPSVNKVFWNRDYSPYARQRDKVISEELLVKGVEVVSFKDHVIFEPHEVLKSDNLPYTVFTPYANKWRDTLSKKPIEKNTIEGLQKQFSKSDYPMPSLESIGFVKQDNKYVSAYPKEDVISQYESLRDFPAENGTSKVSLALRFGTISIRTLLNHSFSVSNTYTSELIWREFYQMILWHFPHTVTEEFKPKYAPVPWRNSEKDFELWKTGNTGIALVDAGMRELNETGFMHNRVRMITASFLCKNLLINWRWGEAYFAEKLMDYELASNVGGWQWSASCGCDAAPYFRVFNPDSQAKKFDPNSEYIRRWVPEFENSDYKPMVDLKESRKASIEIYKNTLNQ